MKKIYFIAICASFISNIQAQLTLTQALNEPIISDFYDVKNIDSTTALPLNITGTSVTWNFTGLNETPALSTYTFSSPSAYAGSSTTFPGVTSVRENLATSDLTYLKSTATTYEIVGVTQNIGGYTSTINYNTNSALVFTYPVSMGYSNTDIGSGSISTSTLSGTFTSTIQTMADGSGTLNLNGSTTLTNCLRVKTKQNLAFSYYSGALVGNINQVFYNYYHSSSKYPVFTVNYTHITSPGNSLAGIPPIDNKAVTIEGLTSLVLGVKENNLNKVSFTTFPNPAKNELAIRFTLTQNENYTIEITNTLGQIVKVVSMQNLTPGLYNQTVNVSDLKSGIYSLQLKGINSTGTQKIIIE